MVTRSTTNPAGRSVRLDASIATAFPNEAHTTNDAHPVYQEMVVLQPHIRPPLPPSTTFFSRPPSPYSTPQLCYPQLHSHQFNTDAPAQWKTSSVYQANDLTDWTMATLTGVDTSIDGFATIYPEPGTNIQDFPYPLAQQSIVRSFENSPPPSNAENVERFDDYQDDFQPTSTIHEEYTPAIDSSIIPLPVEALDQDTMRANNNLTLPAEQDESKVKTVLVAKDYLAYSTVEAGAASAVERVHLQVEHDDWPNVKIAQIYWIMRILQSFDQQEDKEPPNADMRSPEQKEYFSRWQLQMYNSTADILNRAAKTDPAYAERCAWLILAAVLDVHQHGARASKKAGSFAPNLTLKCSERLMRIIMALEQYTIIRYDVLRQIRIDELAANPPGFANRKLVNVWVNYRKKLNNSANGATRQTRRSGNAKVKPESKTVSLKIAASPEQLDSDNEDGIGIGEQEYQNQTWA